MRKIAVVVDDEIRPFTLTRIAGIARKFSEAKNNVNMYIFRSSGSSSMDEKYNLGEYNVYHLPDFNDYDGIIIDLNNVKKNDRMSAGVQASEYVIEQIRRSGKPAISIANNIEDFYYVGIDNYAAMKTMVAHLHEVHGCRKLWGVMGPKGNYESEERARAIQEYMDEHGLPYEDKDFYYESYEYKCGMNGFEELAGSHGFLPDAILCANDNIAIGVCEKAREMGYHIPGDFCVTGFDNFDKAWLYTPRISTVDQMTEATGYQSAEIMLKILNGEEVSRINYIETESVFWDSCGCRSEHEKDADEYIQEEIRADVANTEYNEQMKVLNYGLVQCESVADICREMAEHISIIKDISLYLIVDESFSAEEEPEEAPDYVLSQRKRFCIHGYPENMNMIFAYEQGMVKDVTEVKVEKLFPAFESETDGTNYTFIPLHFSEYTVGYYVVKNGLHLIGNRYLVNVINAMSRAIESLYHKNLLKFANEMLSKLYIRDSMTGLYNRLGYQKKGLKLYNQKRVCNENMTIMFIDMDCLKFINDNYGHEYGDFAIKTIATAIVRNCAEDSVVIRWGGDEFLVLMPELSGEELDALKQNVREEIAENARKIEMPCPLTVSIGNVTTDMSAQTTIDEYIQRADAEMYTEKIKKKGKKK